MVLIQKHKGQTSGQALSESSLWTLSTITLEKNSTRWSFSTLVSLWIERSWLSTRPAKRYIFLHLFFLHMRRIWCNWSTDCWNIFQIVNTRNR